MDLGQVSTNDTLVLPNKRQGQRLFTKPEVQPVATIVFATVVILIGCFRSVDVLP